jgi:hypothetical protein
MQTPVTPLPEGPRELLAFFENVRAVEEWAGIQYQLPEELSSEDAVSAAVLAHIIRAGGREIIWRESSVTVPESSTEPLKGGHVLRWEQPLQANLLGRTETLGFVQTDVVDYKLVSEEPADGEPGYVVARVEPTTDEAAHVFERLVKESTATGGIPALLRAPRVAGSASTAVADDDDRPPRPPKRKHSKKSSNKRSKRGKPG